MGFSTDLSAMNVDQLGKSYAMKADPCTFMDRLFIALFSEEGSLLKWISKKIRKPLLLLIIIIFFIAGLLDLKYEGLFFQLLPKSIQSYLGDIF